MAERASQTVLLPLEQVNPSVGPLAYLDLFERVALETVSRAVREEVRAPVLWRRQLVIRASTKEGRLVNDVLKWRFGNNGDYPCASLTSLDVTGCTELTDESIKAVAAGCGNSLTSLNVTSCSNLTDESMKAVAVGCASLTSLNVACANLTDESIKAVAAGCGNSLKELGVSFCSKITDESIKAVAAGCSGLTSLIAMNCQNLTDESITAVAAGCSSLTTLVVAFCSNITNESIEAVASHCSSLTSLDVSCCFKITDESIELLKRARPDIRVVHH